MHRTGDRQHSAFIKHKSVVYIEQDIVQMHETEHRAVENDSI